MSSKLRYRVELGEGGLVERALREAGGDELSGAVDLVVESDDVVPAEILEATARRLAELLDSDEATRTTLQKRAAAGRLGAGIVHEVRNILAGIRGFAQVALSPDSDEAKTQRLLGRLESETQRCIDTVSRYLRFSRDNTSCHERLDVNELVSEAAELLAPHARTKRVRIQTTLGEGVPPIWGDMSELLQLLVNLGLNAQQAMPEGGDLGIASSRTEDGRVIVRVSDTGPGIPDGMREQIFEPYFTTKEQTGTGLGLALSRQIARAHKGSLSVAPSERGACFELVLPALPGGEA